MRQTIIAGLLACALVAGCGDEDATAPTAEGAPGSAGGGTDTIRIADFVYDPAPATVKAGRPISIPNADAAPHTITDRGSDKAFDSGTIKGKATGSLTIDEPGSYRYICEFHPFMKGEITVTR